LYVRNHIAEKRPDVVVNVVDASNLERNLFLTTQLIDMNIKVVIALNMYDELEQKFAKLDYDHLGEMMGIPIVPTVASKGKGLKALFDRIIMVYEERDPIVRHIHINYGEEIEKSIRAIQTELRKEEKVKHSYSTRFLAIKLLEEDNHTLKLLNGHPIFEAVKKVSDHETSRLEQRYKDQSETLIADAKYGFIAGALKETYRNGHQVRRDQSREIDKVLTHHIWGFPFFILFIWITFQATFTLGSYPMEWLDAGIGWLGNLIGSYMPDGALKDLVIDGVIGGVGGVRPPARLVRDGRAVT
jgi:ferrous iron transport protein B